MPIDLRSVVLGIGGFVIYGADAGDQSGFSVSFAGDVNGDGFEDLIIGAPYADGPGAAPSTRSNAGDSYVVFGSGTGFPAAIDLVSVAAGIGGFAMYGADAGDDSGISVSSAGDINGDGFEDLIIGADRADGPGAAPGTRNYAGDSYVVFGHAGGFGAIDLRGVALNGFVIWGADSNDRSGFSVSSAGDVNGDGFDDLIIGAPYADGPGAPAMRSNAGNSYVVFGRGTDFPAAIDLANAAAGSAFTIYGADANDQSGRSVSSAGDVNGDGFDDLIIGAPYADGPGAPGTRSDAGDSYVVFGHAGGFGAAIDLRLVALGVGGFVIWGADANDQSGRSVASAGDVNGDGFDDLIIGAPYADGPGAPGTRSNAGDSYVVFGHAGGFGAAIDLRLVALGLGGFVIYGADANDQSGRSVASAGDVNGDGFDDLIIGAPFADGPGAPGTRSYAGDSYVVFGHAGGFGAAIDLRLVALGIGGFAIYGADANDQSGRSVSSGGDVNGDGFDDLIIGAPFADGPGAPGTRADAGDSYVLFGSATVGGSANQVTHLGGDGAQTLTGNAAANIMVGGRGNDNLVANGGADVLIGGQGNDTLRIRDATFRRVEGGSGTDVLAFGGAVTLADTHFQRVFDVESLRLGNGATNLTLGAIASRAIDGTATNNFLIAIDGTHVTAGSLTINAGALTRPVSVTMGAANDSVTILGGTVTVNGGGGIDTVKAAISYTLGTNTENLTLLGSSAINGTGNGLANTITGNGAANILNGGLGNDVLIGGLGTDKLIGGAGNDTYVLANGIDTVTDSGGIDTITSTITRSLASFGTIEKLTLLGPAAINGTGNGLANTITGNSAANILNGGLGTDTLIGNGGNDTYVLANSTDTVIDTGGIDTITSTAHRSLASFGTIEKLTLLGSAAINGTGNGLANTITGNGAANILNGGLGNDVLIGGLGTDTLIGGAGNDTYVLANSIETVSDSGGIDTITSTAHRSLASFGTIEKLTLLGSAAINGTGNGLANTITGNGAANLLNGGLGNDILSGGLGKDTMTGGPGADDFDFNSVAEIGLGTSRDNIKDFTHLSDDIDLSTIDANGSAVGHTFLFLATKGAAFTGVAGQVRWFQASGSTLVEGDIDGNKLADFQIQLTGLKSLTSDDFIL